MNTTVLVTGGAGYIGSHTVRRLIAAGHRVVVLDNLSTGHRWAVHSEAAFVEGDTRDRDRVRDLLREHEVGAVIHFAAHLVVPESVAEPAKYYANNIGGTTSVADACCAAGVRHFIFSSTAAVYGIPPHIPVSEDTRPEPINPYGTSKLVSEWLLRDLAARPGAHAPFGYVALRYFNVAGASLDGRLGQATANATHLIKVAAEAACGRREAVTVFGSDYPTPDGTCIRDYIHVEDLADAHVLALSWLLEGGAPLTLNCGYGHGFSVREVLDCVRAVSGRDFPIVDGPRRAGDPPALVADPGRLRERLGWRPRHDDLRTICHSAWAFERSLGVGGGGPG
jgi:UDP-glucose 4-epimerase